MQRMALCSRRRLYITTVCVSVTSAMSCRNRRMISSKLRLLKVKHMHMFRLYNYRCSGSEMTTKYQHSVIFDSVHKVVANVSLLYFSGIVDLLLSMSKQMLQSKATCHKKVTRNSSWDEIANVNFLYDDIVHASATKYRSTRLCVG